MIYSKKFQDALATGKVVVRRAFENAKNPDQITVQFMQQIKSPILEGVSSLVSMAQGIGQFQMVTSLFSFKKEVLAGLGVEVRDYFNDEKVEVPFGEQLFPNLEGTPLNIEVVENFEQNPLAPSQEPKKNPTSKEVITFFDVPVYRHTSIIAGEPNNVFMTQKLAEEVLRPATSRTVKLAADKVEEVFQGAEA